VKAVIVGKNITLSRDVIEASSIIKRVIGLMFRPSLDCDSSMLINPCNSIHTCFMKFPIDVIFIDKKNEIIKIIRDMKPWRFSSINFNSKKVLELNAGAVGETVEIGDKLEFVDV